MNIDIRHIAKLARLRIEDEKLEKYREECKDEAIDMLKEYFFSCCSLESPSSLSVPLFSVPIPVPTAISVVPLSIRYLSTFLSSSIKVLISLNSL